MGPFTWRPPFPEALRGKETVNPTRPIWSGSDQAIGYAEPARAQKVGARARATIGFSRLLGSELRWLARIDSFC